MTKVAFIQNRIQPGGRFQVMAEMIYVLNQKGVVPDLLTFRSRLDKEKVSSFYSRELKYNLKLISPHPKVPFEWNICIFNKMVSGKLRDYDLAINHNNTSFGLRTSTPIISYVHFPRKARLLSGLDDIHLPEHGPPPILNFRKDLLNLMRLWYRTDNSFLPNDRLVANSGFTRQQLVEAYPGLPESEIAILYPPVDTQPIKHGNGREEQVVSLARFSESKRQMEQIEIASQIPELQFKLVGFIGEDEYFKACQQLVAEKKLSNVELLTNVARADLNKLLAQSRYFIHSMREEPFGITPVQAIAAGCVPVVHDSGGQREIVSLPDLRYKSIEEAISILRYLLKETDQSLQMKSTVLQERIGEFGSDRFREKFLDVLNELGI